MTDNSLYNVYKDKLSQITWTSPNTWYQSWQDAIRQQEQLRLQYLQMQQSQQSNPLEQQKSKIQTVITYLKALTEEPQWKSKAVIEVLKMLENQLQVLEMAGKLMELP